MNSIVEKVDTKFWRKETDIKLVNNICQLTHIYGTAAMEEVEKLFCNEIETEEYRLFTMSSKHNEKGLYIKALSSLDRWISTCLEDLARKIKWVKQWWSWNCCA